LNQIDWPPPKSPTFEEQREALARGLGRAMQWARAGVLDEATLLHACLHDLRVENQSEDRRAPWLWKMMQEMGATERFRNPILSALAPSDNEADVNQVTGLALDYAKAGDMIFRHRLLSLAMADLVPFSSGGYDIYDQYDVAMDAVMELDGIDGFLTLAASSGHGLRKGFTNAQVDTIFESGTRFFKKKKIYSALNRSNDPNIVRFRKALQSILASQKRFKQKSRILRQSESPTPEKTIELAQKSEEHPSTFGNWGRNATEAQLKPVIEAIFETENITVLTRLIAVFMFRAWPDFDGRILKYHDHPDDDFRWYVYAALSWNAHPIVREFARSQLEIAPLDRNLMRLFVRNFRPGDEEAILRGTVTACDSDIVGEDRDFEVHSLLHWLLDVLKSNESADVSHLAIALYRWTPCSRCRSKAFEMLVEADAAPAWMIEECRDDASEDARAIAERNSIP
jgi:hypothetical protein